MHATRVLQKLLAPALGSLDRRNAANLLRAVDACLRGRRLVMMELARHWGNAAKVWPPLKRLDRLLSNPSVQAQRCRFYGAVALLAVRTPEPVIVVDWSELKADGRWHLLRAGLVVRGRTLTVYEEVHPQRRLNSPVVHRHFLAALKKLLPRSVTPIIVTDAGFRVPWFREVEALGWHWLGRVRGRVSLCLATKAFAPFLPVADWYRHATPKATALGAIRVTANHQLAAYGTLIRQPPKGRHQVLNRSGCRADSGQARKMARAGGEPWLLVYSPSLAARSARQIVTLYRHRMQIESSFRDLKSHRFGAGFEDTQTRSAERLQMLLLIHLLATLVAWLAAVATTHTHELRFRVSMLRRGWEHLRKSSARIPAPDQALRRLCSLASQAVATP
ncbi:IS4 family transposase [Abyssibacter profundi]|uniref:IS4 family transposase n=1 Tax=Abyssibacter profundi TaxID=2182787 RepID=A0A383XPG9_9GAMM|nr:IS4 family transposase [Abyssibacter profundi]PWN54523.1 IS4 family transposase [Abyssibacter profundi]